jgi:radical SAM superfamily enzyme YgiQ (UPF0313 family)
VKKAAVKSTDRLDPPATMIFTPDTEFGSRFLIEVVRGCANLCRFCWAGYNYLPVRPFAADRILELARAARVHSNKVGLVSIALCDHPEIDRILSGLMEMGYSISPASLRLDDLTDSIVSKLHASGERTITIAPETGSDRLRRVINKTVTNAEILEKANLIFANGIDNLKLYYMIGLPTETEDDVEGDPGADGPDARHHDGARPPEGRVGRIVASVNPLIPKPGTAYQWLPMKTRPSPIAKASGCATWSPISTTSTSTSSRSGTRTTRPSCRSAIAASRPRSKRPSATAATGARPWPNPASMPISTSSATARKTPCCRGTSLTAA